MSEAELKPCPFCGHSASIEESPSKLSSDGFLYRVYCDNRKCGISQGYWKFKKEYAIYAWNTRYKSDSLPEWFINHLKFNIEQNERLLKTCKSLDEVLDNTRRDAINNETRWMRHFLTLRKEDEKDD